MSSTATITATPLVIAQRADRARADAQARIMAARRRDTRKNGYAGPLTRAEASAAALRTMAGRAS